MNALALVLALIVLTLQQGGFTESQATMQQRAHDEYERHKQSAIRINELAGRIQTEADASALVSEIAGLFAKELPPAWASSIIRQRVAHAEYEAVRNPVRFIPEQRIVDVWNQYAREMGAPDEAIVSVAEIHNMRDASFTAAQLMWTRGNQTIWTMPNPENLSTKRKAKATSKPANEVITDPEVITDLSPFQPDEVSALASEPVASPQRSPSASACTAYREATSEGETPPDFCMIVSAPTPLSTPVIGNSCH
jgi:hypothetical protein